MRLRYLEALDERWLSLRQQLWDHCSAEEHLTEMEVFLHQPEKYCQLLATEDEKAIGFLEASIRNDYVNGTSSSPVGYIEGLFVVSECRQKGVAAKMMMEIESWFRNQGCHEMASDTELENQVSIDAHLAMGFEETERAVFFRKVLAQK